MEKNGKSKVQTGYSDIPLEQIALMMEEVKSGFQRGIRVDNGGRYTKGEV